MHSIHCSQVGSSVPQHTLEIKFSNAPPKRPNDRQLPRCLPPEETNQRYPVEEYSHKTLSWKNYGDISSTPLGLSKTTPKTTEGFFALQEPREPFPKMLKQNRVFGPFRR